MGYNVDIHMEKEPNSIPVFYIDKPMALPMPGDPVCTEMKPNENAADWIEPGCDAEFAFSTAPGESMHGRETVLYIFGEGGKFVQRRIKFFIKPRGGELETRSTVYCEDGVVAHVVRQDFRDGKLAGGKVITKNQDGEYLYEDLDADR